MITQITPHFHRRLPYISHQRTLLHNRFSRPILDSCNQALITHWHWEWVFERNSDFSTTRPPRCTLPDTHLFSANGRSLFPAIVFVPIRTASRNEHRTPRAHVCGFCRTLSR